MLPVSDMFNPLQGIALRSVKHAAHGMATLSFYTFCALGCAASGLYRKMTPDMYAPFIVPYASYSDLG